MPVVHFSVIRSVEAVILGFDGGINYWKLMMAASYLANHNTQGFKSLYLVFWVERRKKFFFSLNLK